MTRDGMAVIPIDPGAALALGTDPLTDRARAYAAAELADNTRRTYAVQWEAFAAWCQGRGVSELPASPDDVSRYLASLGGRRSPSTIDVALAAISKAHAASGLPSPCADAIVRRVRRGIRRTEGTAPREAVPLLACDVRRLVAPLGEVVIDRRDRALLLVGFAGALRRSELAALDLVDVRSTRDGIEVNRRRSKTDQEGRGHLVGLPFGERAETCPVRSVEAWLAVRGDAPGPLFTSVTRWNAPTGRPLTGGDVARLIKRRAAAVGLDPERLSGHSLRAGLVTTAAEAGKSLREIMDQTDHRSLGMVLRYVRRAQLFRGNAAAGIGL